MKTSNKLILTAIIIIVISMVAYDFALRAEYRKGEYKSRFYGMEKLQHLSSFNAIDNRAANLVSVSMEQGDNSEIWTQKNWRDNFKVYKNGTTLVIEVISNRAKKLKPYHQDIITIICPSIQAITTKSYNKAKAIEDDYNSVGVTTVKGFNLDNLLLYIGNKSSVILEKNKIEQLQATVGERSSQNSSLLINSANQIKTASIQVSGKNLLTIDSKNIEKEDFKIADSATINMPGSLFNKMRNQTK